MIAVGVDTHKERHFAVALDGLGQLLGELVVAATSAGYGELHRWAEALADGRELVFGIEGAGSYGAGLVRAPAARRDPVVEVERPRRRDREPVSLTGSTRSRPPRACSPARASRRPAARDPRRAAGAAGRLRSCVGERTRVLNQLQALHATAPVALRERIGEGNGTQLERRVLAMRAAPAPTSTSSATFAVMRDLAARLAHARQDAAHYERELAELVRSLDPTLLEEPGVGPISAAKLLVCDPAASRARQRSRAATAPRRSRPHPARPSATASTAAATAKSTTRSTRSRSPRSAPPRDARLPRPPDQRGQDQTRGHALTQAPPLPPPLQAPHRRCP